HRAAVRVRRERERKARRDVVVIVHEALPVVAQTEIKREIRAWADFILHERADDFLQKRGPAVADLLDERIRPSRRVVLEARKIERAAGIRPIVETAPAPV